MIAIHTHHSKSRWQVTLLHIHLALTSFRNSRFHCHPDSGYLLGINHKALNSPVSPPPSNKIDKTLNVVSDIQPCICQVADWRPSARANCRATHEYQVHIERGTRTFEKCPSHPSVSLIHWYLTFGALKLGLIGKKHYSETRHHAG